MSSKDETPLAIDLFCGLGGWTEGLLAEGYHVVGFDITHHEYGEHRYPAQLVLQDVLTLHGQQFRTASLIVASPPCQAYSWRAMPWKAAKAAPPPDNSLFNACFRIQREASEAAGCHIPLVVENVCGAQKWVGRARWHYGSYYLWGDVPALMPIVRKAVKVGGLDWSKHGQPDYKTSGAAGCFRDSALKNNGGSWFGERDGKPIERNDARNQHPIKNQGGSWFNVAHNTTSGRGRNPDGRDPMWQRGFQATAADRLVDDHVKLGNSWFHGYRKGQGPRNHGSKSVKRKMASALIAKIPFELARHIAAVYHPRSAAE